MATKPFLQTVFAPEFFGLQGPMAGHDGYGGICNRGIGQGYCILLEYTELSSIQHVTKEPMVHCSSMEKVFSLET